MDYLLIAGIIAVPILLIGLFWAGVRTGTKTKDQQSWLDYGNFFIVATGLGAGLLGFLIVLLFLGRFTDTAQGLGYLTALFGVITGLVGTYFGVKQSSDAREGAEQLALGGNTAPAVSITPATDRNAPRAAHTVTATVISVDGSSAANIPVTFRVTDGPDVNTTDTVTTDESGRATFEITNNGTEGTDTIEAAALGGKGTATVEFKP